MKNTSKFQKFLDKTTISSLSYSILLLAAGKGVLRSMLINPDGLIEAIPVDACINGILTLTKHVATEKRYTDPPLNVKFL